MSVPRVFISSTFFDLKHIREDMDRFIRDLGYESIRHEKGNIAYGKEKPLEEYAYRELDLCDMVVTIVGGRFGSLSSIDTEYSITQKEIIRAIEKSIPLFIFVDKSVYTEYSTYLINKENPTVKYKFVDNVKIFEFIDFLYSLPKNNPIHAFESSSDITATLKLQWAGLFQRFLKEQERNSELSAVSEAKSIANTLQQLISYFSKERGNADAAIQSIIQVSNPVFKRIKELTETKYRVFFINESEMFTFLKSRGWTKVDPESFDEDSKLELSNQRTNKYMKFTTPIFNPDGTLIQFTEANWNDQWIQIREYSPPQQEEEDDIPF